MKASIDPNQLERLSGASVHRLRPLIAVLLTLIVSSAALGYSDDAVKDAEAIAARTAKQVDAGEVNRKDVAVVQFHLLEMKVLAKKISRTTFCQSAKSHLELIAANLDADEKPLVDQKKWNEAIASMPASQSGCQVATGIIDKFMFADGPVPHTDTAIRAAELFVDTVNTRFAAGQVTARDVSSARAFLLETKFLADKISRADYCNQSLPDLQTVADGTASGARVGQVSLIEEIVAKRKLFRQKMFCK
jgi:hypothetical protein